MFIVTIGFTGYGGNLYATNDTQLFTNPGGASGYENDMDVTWWIYTNTVGMGVQVQLTFLDLEPPCFDYLDFYREG